MASIEKRKRADGTTGYKAEVVVRVDGRRRKKSATFDRLATANAWAKKIERQLQSEDPRAVMSKPQKALTVADAINKYILTHKIPLKSTKKQVISFVADGRCKFSEIRLQDLSSHDVREFAEELASGGRAPATVSSYLTHTCHILAVAEDDFGQAYHVNLDALDRGKRSARRHGLAGKPKVRDRRPTDDELDSLMSYFERLYDGNKRCIPMHLIIAFAIFGCRRQSEITSLCWDDLNDEEMLVRSMKHPRKPEGVDTVTTLTDEAKRVIRWQGKRDGVRIFPYNSGTISRRFTNACKLLEIEDLHFHDLRHEGISWLLERGWSTRHTMMVSGHSSTQTLDRYSKVRIRGDRYENWDWFARLEGAFGSPAT